MEDQQPPPRRTLATPLPGVADDTGAADPRLRVALAACATEPDDAVRRGAALAALLDARLLVPVVAVLGETGTGAGGLTSDKSADMATVLLTGVDGRTALLAFSGMDALTDWDATARPVPTTAQVAAQAAVQDGAAALLVDVAGPATLVVEGDDLLAVARGWRLATAGGRWAWIGHTPE